MSIDVRARMVCNLGTIIRGDIGDSLLTEGGLIKTTGTLELDGINIPAKGTEVMLAYYRPQSNTITRFPRRVRVKRATADPYRRTTKIDVGCRLAIAEDIVSPTAVYPQTRTDPGFIANRSAEGYVAAYPPISAVSVLLHCLSKTGITLSPGARLLQFKFLQKEIDLSPGYISIVNDLIKSESCYGYLDQQERLAIAKVNLTVGQAAAVLRDADLIDLSPIEGAEEPKDQVNVAFSTNRR